MIDMGWDEEVKMSKKSGSNYTPHKKKRKKNKKH